MTIDTKYKSLYEITGRIEDVNTFLVPLQDLPRERPTQHWSDCAVHSEPAYPKGECDCGGYKPEQEPVATMPSNTRYTVEVEGHGRTYWDNIHDAITNAQRAVYSGPDNTIHALDDLKAGRIAEWNYGFSAVRIYPPQNSAPPQRKPLLFPTMLRKMWSGGEVQDWLDENYNNIKASA